MRNESRCRGCGKKIIWVVSIDTGARIPLDASAPVYSLVDPNERGGFNALREKGSHVSHFAICSKAAQFSASRKKKATAPSDTPA